MKTTLIIFLVTFVWTACAQKAGEESLMYLGVKRPGTTAVKFAPGLVSLVDQHEFGSVFSRNAKEFYFAVDIGGKAEIRFMKLENGKWTRPVTLLADEVFSYNDPMLSPDEKKLFFISDRSGKPGQKKDYDIWYVERNGDQWSLPVNAGAEINSDRNEYYVSFSDKGTMYFSSNRKFRDEWGDGFNICASAVSQGLFQEPSPLGDSVNTMHYEADVFIAPDESYLIFCADRPEGYGAGDLYISFKKSDGTWTRSKNMGERINTPGHELCPFISSDGKYFFYTSNQDIYWVNARIIDELR
jgi:hypothetical protein